MPLSDFRTRWDPSDFLNRSEQLDLVEASIGAVPDDPDHLAVFELVGIGGVGKTWLLHELERRTRGVGLVRHVLRVSLVAQASTSFIGPLRQVREQIGGKCFLFDAALNAFEGAVGQIHVGEGSRLTKALPFKTVETGGRLAPFPMPMTYAVEVFQKLGQDVVRRYRYEKEEFEEIDDLRREPDRLLARLPHYLALDIARRLGAADDSLVVLYDGYEKQAAETLEGKTRWLRDLIQTLGRGIHVISTREPLDWPREARVPLVQRIDVEKLPEDDSRELLRSGLGGLPAETEAQLLAASWRIPLLLQAMVNAYAVRAGENGDVDFDVDPASPEDTLTHLLDHLSSERRRVAVALAAVQIFDQGMYDYLIRELHLQVSDEDFPEIASSLFIEDLPSGLYKTHDLLTDAARRSPSDRALRSAALKAATVYLFTQCAGGGLGEPDKVLPLFGALLAGWCSIDTMPVRSAEVFVDAAYVLYDSGHWRELVSMVPAAAAELPRHHAVAVIAELFAALATRRTVGVDSALTRLDQLRGRSDVLGDHARSVDVELAYLRELSGDYAGVRPEFRSLSRAATPFEPTNRNHLRSRLYHADMLIMDGEFREGSRLLLETYEEIGRRAPLDWAELVRCRARAHYCSFELERAAELLREAMEASSRAPAMLAKLQTNLAEVHSWHEPDRALAEADLAVELNAQLGSKIELAKCDAAKGIALARMGESGAAEDAVERAAAQARAVGYPAGVAFALQARATARALAADHEGFAVAYAELSQALEALGTYGHLRVGPAWLSGDDLRFVESAVDVDWIDPDELEDRLHRYFSA